MATKCDAAGCSADGARPTMLGLDLCPRCTRGTLRFLRDPTAQATMRNDQAALDQAAADQRTKALAARDKAMAKAKGQREQRPRERPERGTEPITAADLGTLEEKP